MPRSRLTGIVIASVGVLLLTASLREVVAEAAPYIAGGVSSEQRFFSLETGSFAPANSQWSKNLFFLDCINAATDPFVLLEHAVESRKAMLQYCLDQAATVLDSQPLYSMAWMAKAVAAAELGMVETMQSALKEAWRTSPNLDWMAEQRIALIDRHPAQSASSTLLAQYRSDLGILLASYSGTEFVAKLYVDQPERRELITATAEGSSSEEQARFLSLVRRMASRPAS